MYHDTPGREIEDLEGDTMHRDWQEQVQAGRTIIYEGWIDEQRDVHVTANGRPLRHVVYHSPDGFAWGYGCRGLL